MGHDWGTSEAQVRVAQLTVPTRLRVSAQESRSCDPLKAS